MEFLHIIHIHKFHSIFTLFLEKPKIHNEIKTFAKFFDKCRAHLFVSYVCMNLTLHTWNIRRREEEEDGIKSVRKERERTL